MDREAPKLRTGALDYDVEAVSDETGLNCQVDVNTGEVLESMTQQHFAEEVDINTIVKRFGIGYQMPEGGIRAPLVADFSDVGDFQSAMNQVVRARESFDELPADVRYRFGNDPGAFVDFCSDDENRAQAEKWGLVFPKAPQEPPAPTRVVIVGGDGIPPTGEAAKPPGGA